MRTFYVFKINREMTLLMKESPYNLFKSLEGIYLLDKTSVIIIGKPSGTATTIIITLKVKA